MPKVPVEKTTFGELEPGDQFVNSASRAAPKSKHDHLAKESSIPNLKINFGSAYVEYDSQANAACLYDGRPRTYSEEETVYRIDIGRPDYIHSR